jgi:hypothetical protein
MSEDQQPSYFERMKLIKLGLAPKEAVAKKKKPLKQVSDKKKKEDAEAKGKGGDSELDLFFDAMLKKCTGKCLFCNSKTTAIDPSFYRDDNEKWSQEANDRKYERTIETMKRASIAHLLAKAIFPSVATNEDNWIELCWSCHTSFDSGKITWELVFDSKERDIVKEKLLNVLPVVAMEERKHKLYGKLQNLVYEDKKGG